ncbi:MMPL family transporter [Leifsonia naganoensis]|uniref:RND superfamily putative drug exporter n=1 Tax=Leifsonia naganoensis TaxID=150025 RepID=A0A853DTD4_9MICO|nr:MMPL family transporter [Leifsonia naganoensis]NYK09330.1 RND superfamily putative drug exporter [Leifsonia naganoensis]
MAELLYRLGKGSAKRAWVVIGAWIVVLAIAGAGFLIGYKGLSSSFDIPGTASGAVTDDLAKKLPKFSGASGTVVLTTKDGSAFTDAQKTAIADRIESAKDLPDVSGVTDPFSTEKQRADQQQQITDGRAKITAATAQLDAGQTQLDAGTAQLDAAQAQLDAAKQQLVAAGQPTTALDAQQAQLDAGRAQLAEQQQKLTDGRTELTTQTAKLDQGAELLSLAKDIRLVSSDGSAALVSVAFDKPRLELSEESKNAVIDHFEKDPVEGVTADFSTELAQGVPEVLGVGELIGVIIAAIVLLVMLGSVIAAALPLVTAILGVAISAVGTLAFSGVVQMASVTPVLGVMLGLAVGIDYALFIINRHRKQLLQGAEVRESIGLATGTAGNAVVFAGATVVIALLALNVTGIPFLGLMGTAGAIAVAVSVLIAITLTPALLGLVGMRVLTKKARARAAAHERRAQKPVRPMKTWRAVVTVVATIVGLLVIAAPILTMRVGLPDGAQEPAGSTTARAYQVIEDSFGAGANGTLLVSATLPAGLDDDQVTATQLTIAKKLADQSDVAAVAPIAVSDDHRLTAFQVVPKEGPSSASTEQLVRDLPAVGDGITLGVAGQAASNIDISEKIVGILPLYLAVVVGLSLIIMIVVFRSFVVPLIATGGFVLSLFATYGAIVAVFQWGWFGALFGIHTTGPILSFLPVILVGILFGLAMDYQLFLSTGMREAYVHGSPARLAVAQGFRAGRSVVIAAGIIMVSVFGGFIFSDSTIIRSLGFGLAFGVLLDAFVVRMLLMPALMHLVGRGAWWLPRWLDRILPNVDVEGANLERRHHVDGAPVDAAAAPATDAEPLPTR